MKLYNLINLKIMTSLFYGMKKIKLLVFKGGKIYKLKHSKIQTECYLLFNKSLYKNGYHRNGNILIGNNSSLKCFGNESKIVIYSGCKIDVHDNAILEIGSGTHINENSRIGCKKHISIGKNCFIGDEVSIHDFDGHKINNTEGIAEIIIGDNCWIGERVTILKGIIIGEGSVIGAGSVITKNIPPKCIAVGNPARVIKENVVWKP